MDCLAGLNSLENSSEQQTANNKRRATVNDMSPMKKKIHLEGDSGDVRDEMKAAEGTKVVEGEDTQSKIEIVKTDEAANDGAFAVNRFRLALKLPKAGVKKTQLVSKVLCYATSHLTASNLDLLAFRKRNILA